MMEMLEWLKLLGILAGMLCGVHAADILFGVYRNIEQWAHNFSAAKLKKGVLRMLAVAGGSGCLVLVFGLWPMVAPWLGVDAARMDGISVAGILVVYVAGIAAAGKQALRKLADILGAKDEYE